LEWSLTLFCKRLPLEVVGRVWDLFFVLGELTVFKTAVAILTILKPKLLGEPFGKILKGLATLPQTIKVEHLCQAINRVKVTTAFKRRFMMLGVDSAVAPPPPSRGTSKMLDKNDENKHG